MSTMPLQIQILRRERLARGWERWHGVVNGRRVVVQLPSVYTEDLSRAAVEAEVRDALETEYLRRYHAEGGAVARCE